MGNFEIFIQQLKEQLQKPLAGFDAHFKMMPEIRIKNFTIEKPNNTTRKGAVLLLLFEDKNEIKTVLIHRNTYKGTHSDQMAFPGGKYDDTDITLSTTALRETNEEIGVNANDIQIIGSLSNIYIPPSNFSVQPFVGYINYKPQFIPEEKEVKEIVEIAIYDFLNTENIKKLSIKTNDYTIYDVPCWDIKNKIIWGATAMILSEFCEVINTIPR